MSTVVDLMNDASASAGVLEALAIYDSDVDDDVVVVDATKNDDDDAVVIENDLR